VFNKETEYALRGLVYVQVQNNLGRKPGIAEIAREIEAPPFYTGKIMQRLVKQGLVLSSKGKGGGFYFDGQQADLKLLDVIRVTEGTRLLEGCGFGLRHCNELNPCPLHHRFVVIRNEIHKLVNDETIQLLAEKIQNGNMAINRLTF
jgi:Rrf2 family protein